MMTRQLRIAILSLLTSATLYANPAEEIHERCPGVPLTLAEEMSASDTPAAVYLGWLQLTKHEGPARTLLAATEVRAALTCERREEISDPQLLNALHWAGMNAAGYPQPETQRDVMTVLEIVAQSTSAYDGTIYQYFVSKLYDEEMMIRVTAAGKLILYRERPDAIEAIGSLLDQQPTRSHGLNALAIIFSDPWVPLDYAKPLLPRIRRALFSVDSEEDRMMAASVLGKLGKEAEAAVADLESVRDKDRSKEVRQYAAEALRNILGYSRYYEERAALREKRPLRRRPS